MSNVQAHSEAMQNLRLTAYALHNIAYAFGTTGNQHMCDLLHAYADDLDSVRQTCENIFMQENQARFDDARQASTSMLGTIMAMADIKPKE